MSDDLNHNLQLILAVSRGIVQNQRLRRQVLGGVLGASLLMLGMGVFPLAEWLGKHLLLFLLYWGACAWLTVLAILMALFDLLMARKSADRERRELARSLFKDQGGKKRS